MIILNVLTEFDLIDSMKEKKEKSNKLILIDIDKRSYKIKYIFDKY